MMRVVMTFFWGLLVAWLLTTELEAQGPPRKNQAKPKININDNNGVLTVTGYGLDIETAKRDAIKEAQKELTSHLQKSNPPVRYWKPSEAYVEASVVPGSGAQDKGVQVEDGEIGKTWIVKVRVPDPRFAAEMDAQAKRYADRRTRELSVLPRLHILSKSLTAMMVVLLALVGYLRLEELTRGIYTHLLRIGMICLVAAAGAGILFLS